MHRNAFDIGKYFIAAGKPVVALQWLEKARAEMGDDPGLLLLLGIAQYGAERLDEAEATLIHLRDMAPDNPYPLWQLGLIHHKRGAFDACDACFRQAEAVVEASGAAERMATHRDVYVNLSKAFERQGDLTRAMDILERIGQFCPDDYEILFSIMMLALSLGDLEMARDKALAARAVASNPAEHTEVATCARAFGWMMRNLDAIDAAPKPAPDPDGRPDLVVCQASWGADYLTLFLYHLRSMLAPGNLPRLAERFRLTLNICITPSNRDGLEASGIADALREIAEVRYVILGDDLFNELEHFNPSGYMYILYSLTMHMGLAWARHIGGAATMLTADTVAADGSFALVEEMIENDTLAICGNGLVCDRETFLAALDERFPDPVEPIAVDARTMAALGKDRLHELIRCAIVSPSNADFDHPPAVLFWRTPDGLAAHGFNLQPYYLSAELLARYRHFWYRSVDGNVLDALLDPTDFPRVKVIPDAKRFSIVTLTSFYRRPHTTRSPFNIGREIDYVKKRQRVGPFNMYLFKHRLLHDWVADPDFGDEYDPAIPNTIIAEFEAHQARRRGQDGGPA